MERRASGGGKAPGYADAPANFAHGSVAIRAFERCVIPPAVGSARLDETNDRRSGRHTVATH